MSPTPTPGCQWHHGDAAVPAADYTHSIPPQVSDWLPALLEQLLPRTTRLVREQILQFEPQALQSGRLPGYFTREILRQRDGVRAQGGLYADTIAEYALREPDSDMSQQLRERWHQQLTSIGQRGGHSWLSSDWVYDLVAGPVAIHEQTSTPARIRIELTDAWLDIRRATAARSLTALGALAEAFAIDVVVPSQAHHEAICERFASRPITPDACTGTRESPLGGDHSTRGDTAEAHTTARSWAAQATDDTGPVRILHVVGHAPEQMLAVDTLAADETVACARDSVYAYVRSLDAAGLVSYHADARHDIASTVTLTEAGERACEYIDASGGFRVRDPVQTQLGDECIHTHNAKGSAVGSAVGGTGQSQSVEAWLAQMPDLEATGRWTRWLEGPEGMEPGAVHRRQTAPLATGADVALANVPIEDWAAHPEGDARGSYVSFEEGELLTVVQYALDPLLTLARLAASVTAPQVLRRCFTTEAAGETFEALFEDHDRALGELDRDTTAREQLVGGLQLGWLSDDEETITDLCDRWRTVRSSLVEEAARLSGRPGARGDMEARQECFTRLHGLVSSVTSLLYAAGIDHVVNLRVPQTKTLQSDALYRRDFLDFCRYTIPKQAVTSSTTGWHNWFRQAVDPEAVGWDSDTLRSRLPLGEEQDTSLTTKWVLTGPDITELQDRLCGRLRRERARLQTTQVVPPVSVAIEDMSHPAAHQALIEAKVETPAVPAAETRAEALATVTQVCERLFARDDGRWSPHLVAAVVDAATSTGRLTETRLCRAAATVPPTRLLPTEPASVGHLFTACVEDPSGRSDLCARLGIHPNTYDRAVGRLQALGLVDRKLVDGYPRWQTTLGRWWTPSQASESECKPVRPTEEVVTHDHVYAETGSPTIVQLPPVGPPASRGTPN